MASKKEFQIKIWKISLITLKIHTHSCSANEVSRVRDDVLGWWRELKLCSAVKKNFPCIGGLKRIASNLEISCNISTHCAAISAANVHQPSIAYKAIHKATFWWDSLQELLLEPVCFKKQQKKSLLNMGPLKILNGIKLTLNDQGNHLDSYTMSLESFRSFRGPLFHKPVIGQELFFAVSFSKPAPAFFDNI